MPPRQGMYLLGNGKEAKHNELHFSDFFYLHRLREKLDLIEMEDFLRDEVRVASPPVRRGPRQAWLSRASSRVVDMAQRLVV